MGVIDTAVDLVEPVASGNEEEMVVQGVGGIGGFLGAGAGGWALAGIGCAVGPWGCGAGAFAGSSLGWYGGEEGGEALARGVIGNMKDAEGTWDLGAFLKQYEDRPLIVK